MGFPWCHLACSTLYYRVQPLDQVRQFKLNHLTCDTLRFDNGALSGHLGGVYALPTTFIVDTQGNVTSRIIGVFPVEERREELMNLTAQSPGGS